MKKKIVTKLWVQLHIGVIQDPEAMTESQPQKYFTRYSVSEKMNCLASLRHIRGGFLLSRLHAEHNP